MKPPGPHRRVRIVVEVILALGGLAMIAWALVANRAWYEHHMTWAFCARDPEELVKATRQRWVGAIVGVIVLLGVRPLVGRWASRRSARALSMTLLRTAGATALALLLCDVVLRYRPPKQGLRIDPPHAHTLPHPDYGWWLVPSYTTRLDYGDRVFQYQTGALGERVAHAGDESDPALPTILFPGESITSGIGLEYDETYPAMVSRQLGVQSVNLGVQGYGNDEEYFRAKGTLPVFAKPLAIVSIVIAPQVERNTWEGKEHFELTRDGRLTRVSATPELIRNSPVRDLFRRIVRYRSDEALGVTRALLRSMRDLARARGAYPFFVYTHWGPPCLPDETGAPSQIRALFEGEDLDYVYVDLEGTWVESIHHPGVEGHKRIADAIVRELRGKIPLAHE